MVVRQGEVEVAVPSNATSAMHQVDRPPLVTRHVPNRGTPADVQASGAPVSLEAQHSQVNSLTLQVYDNFKYTLLPDEAMNSCQSVLLNTVYHIYRQS